MQTRVDSSAFQNLLSPAHRLTTFKRKPLFCNLNGMLFLRCILCVQFPLGKVFMIFLAFLQALSSLQGLHGSEAPVSTESAQSGEGSAEAEAAAGRRRLSRRSK
jgi:hypothetical protein